MAVKAALIAILFLASFSEAVFPRKNKYIEENPLKLQSSASVDTENLASKPKLPHNVNVFQYDIKIQPYFTAPGVTYDQSRNFTFDGSATAYFQMLETTTSITFDAYNLNIYAIALFSSDGIKQQLVSANFDNSTNRITVAPVTFLRANQNYTVSFGYRGYINPYNYGGLFYSTYTYANGTQGNVYATFFELGYGARSVYPCIDDPHFKALFNLTVVYPKSLVALANTLEDSTVDAGNGYQATRFKLTKPMSTYLLAFAIGDLVSKSTTTKDGILIRAWSWKGTDLYLDDAVNTSKTCVEVMTDFTGIQFPLEKLDHLAVPHFAAGGMENWGLIVYAAQYVFYDQAQDSTLTRIAGIDVRCHEIAHQWFGDLVTADWWSNIMLHESFAAYFEDYAMLQGWPEQSEYWDPAYVASSIEDGFKSDMNNSHPVITQDGTFDGVVYAKGSALLRMLSDVITPAIYQSGLRNYLTTYQYSTADHYQLFEAMNAVLPPAVTDWCNNPLNITRFMEPWLTQPHFPILTVTYDQGSHSYFVDQQPFIRKDQIYPPSSQYLYAWPIPFTARQVSTNSKRYWTNRYYQCPHNFEVDASSIPGVQIPAVNDDPLIVNANSNTFARVLYDDYTFNKIVTGLEQRYFKLSSEALIRLINDELALVHRDEQFNGQTSYLRSMRIVEAALINNNTNSAAVFAAAKSLIDEMIRLGVDMAERELFESYFQEILSDFYQSNDWDSNGSDKWNTNVLRERLLFYAVLFNIGDARRKSSFLFNQLYTQCGSSGSWVACNNISPDLRAAMYCGAIITDFDGTIYTNISGLLQNVQQEPSPSRQERNALIEGLACSQRETDLRKFVILATASATGRPEDLQYLVRNPIASDVIYYELLNNLATISSKPNGFQYALLSMTYNWFTPQRIEQLHELIPLLTPDQYRTFLNIYSDVIYRSTYGQGAYMEITRHLYDAYFPTGHTPWVVKLPSYANPLTYQLSVMPYIPNQSFKYFSEKNFTFDANITITMITTTATAFISLNSHRQVIDGYSVLNVDTNKTLIVSSVTRNFNNAIIVLHLNDTIPANSTIQVCFNYSGFIFEQSPSEGTISNYDYLQSDGRKSWIFATDFEGGPSTRSLAPSFDEPAYKAKWQVTIIYPGEFTALSNTLDETTINLHNGLVQTTFKQTNLMSSYLLALTIGHYSCLKGVSNIDQTLVRIWTWTGMENYGQHALNFAIDAVDHMSATLSTPMPLEKFDILALPQYSGYSAGAMENWGLVIAGYYDVLFHPDYSSSAELENIQNTVTHELVHHWFGDLVTLDWWTHIFLNEGFATFWPPEILAAKSPAQKNSVLYTKFSIHEHGLLQDDNQYSARPVVPGDNSLGDDYCLFCDTVYDKAGSIISTLRNAFGRDAAFYDGLSQYMKAWSLKNPSDRSLWAALDSAAKQYRINGWSGQYLDVTGLMLPYTYQWTAPYLRIISKGNGQYSIAQNPLVPASSLNYSEYNYRWNIPYRYQINGSSLSSVQYLTSTETFINVNANANTPVIINPQAQTHARVIYDDASWAPIYQTFMSNPFIFDETSRAQILADSWAFLQKKNSVTWDRFLNLTLYLQKETSPLVWRYVIRDGSWVQSLYDRFRYQNTTMPKLLTYFSTITSGMATPNFTLTGDWSVDTANALLVDLKCGISTDGNTECIQKAKASFSDFINQCQNSAYGTGRCNPAPPDFRPSQFCYGLKYSSGDYFAAVFSLYQWWQKSPLSDHYFPQDPEFLLNGLSCSQDPGKLYDLITRTLNMEIPSVFLSFVAGNDNLGSILSNYLQAYQSNVLNSPLFDEYIKQMVSNWSTDDQKNFLVNLLATAPLTQAQKNTVQAAINTVANLQQWLRTEGTPISTWLTNFVNSLSSTTATPILI